MNIIQKNIYKTVLNRLAMANNNKLIDDGRATRFSSTTQPANRGRKKSLYKRLKELVMKNDVQLTMEDFCKIECV